MKPSTFPLAGQLKALRDTGNMPVVKGEQDQPEADQVTVHLEIPPEAAADPGDLLLFGRSELPSDRQRGGAGLPLEHPVTGVKGS